LIRYVHGSEDSLDLDVLYVFEKMPDFSESQSFCSDKVENRNIITIENGIVSGCFKGTVDELNNGLLATYSLHEQTHPLIIIRSVERDVLMKSIRVLRCLLSHVSRTKYREYVKKALKDPNWKTRLSILSSIEWGSIQDFGPKGNREDIFKVFAFQLGQVLSLFNGVEVYTKKSAGREFPELIPFLYRMKNSDISVLVKYIQKFTDKIDSFHFEQQGQYVHFFDYDKTVDLKAEKYM